MDTICQIVSKNVAKIYRGRILRNPGVSARVRNFLQNGHPWAENRNRKSCRIQFFEANPMEYAKTFSELSFDEIRKFKIFEIRPPNFLKSGFLKNEGGCIYIYIHVSYIFPAHLPWIANIFLYIPYGAWPWAPGYIYIYGSFSFV